MPRSYKRNRKKNNKAIKNNQFHRNQNKTNQQNKSKYEKAAHTHVYARTHTAEYAVLRMKGTWERRGFVYSWLCFSESCSQTRTDVASGCSSDQTSGGCGYNDSHPETLRARFKRTTQSGVGLCFRKNTLIEEGFTDRYRCVAYLEGAES